MSLITSVYSLGKTVALMAQKFESYSPEDTEQEREQKREHNKQIAGAKTRGVGKQAVGLSIAVANYSYNVYRSVSRFGNRGQDIQDQLNLQDSLVKSAITLTGAATFGGIVGFTLTAVSMAVNEITSVAISNAKYNYKARVDADQKAIFSERVGQSAYNSSRRG